MAAPGPSGVAATPRLDPATVRRLAWALLAAGIALRAWAQLSLPLAQDDFAALGRAAAIPADPGSFVTSFGTGHSPLALGLGLLVTWIAPLQAWATGMAMALGWTLAAVLAWRIAADVLGPRPIALVPLAVVVASPIALPATARWATAPDAIAMTIALLLTVWAALRGERGDTGGAAWRAAVAALLGLLATGNPLSTVTVLLVVGVSASIALDRQRRGWRSAMRRGAATWGPLLLAAVIGWGAAALHGLPLLTMPMDVGPVMGSLGAAIAQGLVPGLVGGPIAWLVVGVGAPPIADPPLAVVLVAGEVVILLVIAALARRTGGGRAWAIALAGAVLLALAPALESPRTVAAAGATLLALAPVVVLAAVAVTASLAGGPPRRESAGRTWTIVAGVVVVDVVLVAAAVSTSAWRASWAEQTDPEWLPAAIASARAADPGVALLDQAVPERVVSPALAPDNTIATVLAPIADRPPIASSTSRLLLFDADGALVPGEVVGLPATPGPEPSCGWRWAGSELTIPLEGYSWVADPVVDLRYTSSSDVTISISFDGAAEVPIALSSGTGSVYASLVGTGAALRVTRVPVGASVCITGATVGIARIPGLDAEDAP